MNYRTELQTHVREVTGHEIDHVTATQLTEGTSSDVALSIRLLTNEDGSDFINKTFRTHLEFPIPLHEAVAALYDRVTDWIDTQLPRDEDNKIEDKFEVADPDPENVVEGKNDSGVAS